MSITKEQLRSLIREQMSNVSEVADDHVPMMPPKPVDPEGIAGTDVPVASLSDGFDAAREAVKAMYSPTDRRYDSAMMVIDMAEKQDQEKTQDKEQTDDSAMAPGRNEKTWDFLSRSMPDHYKKEENPFRVTKEHLQRIIQEELEAVLKEGYRGPAYRYSKKGMATAALKRQQLKKSEEMKEKGEEDALTGKPKDESITHLAYSQAYDKALEQESNPVQEQ